MACRSTDAAVTPSQLFLLKANSSPSDALMRVEYAEGCDGSVAVAAVMMDVVRKEELCKPLPRVLSCRSLGFVRSSLTIHHIPQVRFKASFREELYTYESQILPYASSAVMRRTEEKPPRVQGPLRSWAAACCAFALRRVSDWMQGTQK